MGPPSTPVADDSNPEFSVGHDPPSRQMKRSAERRLFPPRRLGWQIALPNEILEARRAADNLFLTHLNMAHIVFFGASDDVWGIFPLLDLADRLQRDAPGAGDRAVGHPEMFLGPV